MEEKEGGGGVQSSKEQFYGANFPAADGQCLSKCFVTNLLCSMPSIWGTLRVSW